MANVQHVAINQRHQRQHHSPSGLDFWAGHQEPIDYSLPYPPHRFHDDIQSSDSSQSDEAVSSPRRAHQKMRARESLPSRAHHREPAASRRDGKESLAYSKHHQQRTSRLRSSSASTSGSSSRSESSSESEAGSRTRSRSLSPSGSESGSTAKSESVDSGVVTPKSAHEERSASESEHSSSSSSESEHSSSESESESESIELPAPRIPEKKGKGHQLEKEIVPAVPEPKASSSRRHGNGKEHRAKDLVIHEDKSDTKPRYDERARSERTTHKRRHRNHSSSKAGSRRHHRHRERDGDIRPASSSKR